MLLVLVTGCNPAETPAPVPDGAWYWGDLHAHSAWSWDGCEVWEEDCAIRGSGPGEDFFDNAAGEALDFAALTDHAEADWLYPDSTSAGLDIWAGQTALVQAAESGAVLPILGYEWTAFRTELEDDRLTGTHRTVLLSASDACTGYRVPGWEVPGGEKAHDLGGMVYAQDDPAHADTPADLWKALSQADRDCAPVRWVTFAHHPAYEVPQVTDWTLSENVPEQETVVEIYSEHGSSECIDTSTEGCDWRVNTAQGYYPDGSIQAALIEGHRLGFVAGTDSHDARPGSLDDGPSHIAHWEDTDFDGEIDTPKLHFSAGGLTGVWLNDGESLTTDSLFDAIEARTTAASSGPRPMLTAIAEGADGVRYPPGSVLPDTAMPATILLSVSDPGAEYDSLVIERIGPDGVIGTAEGLSLSQTWSSSEGDWTYLRLRYITAEREQRVWLSPWFEQGRRCGCQGAAAAGPWWLFMALVLYRRRSSFLAAARLPVARDLQSPDGLAAGVTELN